jgi:hypothetical protein
MREQRILIWCDACAAQSGDDAGDLTLVEATESFTVGITQGEERPTLKLLELCEPHFKELLAPVISMIGQTGQVPELATKSVGPLPRTGTRKIYPSGEATVCRICELSSSSMSSLVSHIWAKHNKEPRPEVSTVCVECGEEFGSPGGARMHRTMTHNFSALDEAYARARQLRIKFA